jgi:putative salt-induced outer membrane protein YdiY
MPWSKALGASCAALALCSLSAVATAQATVKNDDRLRSAFGLGASFASGNTDATNLSVTADGVRATDEDKLSLYLRGQYARSNDSTTADQTRLGARHDQNIGVKMFSYLAADFERNRIVELSLRSQLGGGLGYHFVKADDHHIDLFSGLSYSYDRYASPTLVDDELRVRYSYLSLNLGEESQHQLTDSTRFKQRLNLLPNLKARGEYRATWDADLAVAINKTLNLTVGVAFAYNSDPGLGRRSADTLLTTGISVKFD